MREQLGGRPLDNRSECRGAPPQEQRISNDIVRYTGRARKREGGGRFKRAPGRARPGKNRAYCRERVPAPAHILP